MSFWRRPGYGDFLEALTPGTRQRMIDLKAPEGFEDAVAWLVDPSDERRPDDAPSRWNVTFGVDDADAIASRAEKLGGAILMAPLDAPGSERRSSATRPASVHGEPVRPTRAMVQPNTTGGTIRHEQARFHRHPVH